MTKIRTLTMIKSGRFNSMDDSSSSPEPSRPSHPSLVPLGGNQGYYQNRHNNNPNFESDSATSALLRASQISLSLMAASLLHRTIRKPKRSLSPSATTTTATTPSSETSLTKPSTTSLPTPTPLLLTSLPKDVLTRDILGFLTDKSVKAFLESLGPERIRSASCLELRKQFCPKHGARLEDPDTFVTSGVCVSIPEISKPGSCRKRSCPECYAERQNTKRCHGCKVFYPRFHNDIDNFNDKSFPGLRCQKCDHMAFCNACLSNDVDGCGSEPTGVLATTLLTQGGGAFGRKLDRSRKYCGGRVSCQNYCCPNVFTNTMCGEFVCDDCADENLRHQRRNAVDADDGTTATALPQETHSVEVCEECGKATCLDPNCLVCADFKLIHMSCRFSPEDAYKVDLGGILWGTKNNGSNSNLSTKLRRKLSDGIVWILVIMALSKMWWFQQQQHLEQQQQHLEQQLLHEL